MCRCGRNGFDKEVNLLLISENNVWHYMAIKSLSRLLASSNSKHKPKQHFCKNFYKDSWKNPAGTSFIPTVSIMNRSR